MNKELYWQYISDSVLEKIKVYTIREKGMRGGKAKSTRHFTNGIFWIFSTEEPR